MRIESSVTSVSWIPSEAVEGPLRLPFDLGVGHYDQPPPDRIDDLERLRQTDAFRFANELRAFIEVEDGRITNYGHLGRCHMGSTTLRFGPREVILAATLFPEIRPPCEVTETSVTFVQTAGGRPGVPLPRPVRRAPYVQLLGPTVWSTLALTMHVDGSTSAEMRGASPFPRHWIYNTEGELVAKSATLNFTRWTQESFGGHTPWGDEDATVFVSMAETALERRLSRLLMSVDNPTIRRVSEGEVLVGQGWTGTDLFLLLDGVLEVDVDGEVLAQLGPGAVIGERSVVERGVRTATLRAVTPVKVAVSSAERLDHRALTELAGGHRREEVATGPSVRRRSGSPR